MATFPQGFAERSQTLDRDIGQLGNDALARLQEKGLIVATGLTVYFAGAISIMGRQQHIREYCPKDSTPARFGTLRSTEKWLQKGGGRGMFMLLQGKESDARLIGYGWTGVERNTCLPDHPITSAYRIGEEGLGKRLSRDFTQVIVSGTHALYAPDDGIGLETWKSNKAAGMYQDVGFIALAEALEEELRPTLQADAVDGMVLDRRVFMGYQGHLLD